MAFIFTAQSETIKKVIKTHVSVSVDSQIFQNQKHSPGARWYSQAKAKQAQLGNVLNKSRKVIDKVVDDPLTAVKDGAEKVVQTGKETIVKGQRTMEKVSKQGKNVVLEVTQQGKHVVMGVDVEKRNFFVPKKFMVRTRAGSSVVRGPVGFSKESRAHTFRWFLRVL